MEPQKFHKEKDQDWLLREAYPHDPPLGKRINVRWRFSAKKILQMHLYCGRSGVVLANFVNFMFFSGENRWPRETNCSNVHQNLSFKVNYVTMNYWFSRFKNRSWNSWYQYQPCGVWSPGVSLQFTHIGQRTLSLQLPKNVWRVIFLLWFSDFLRGFTDNIESIFFSGVLFGNEMIGPLRCKLQDSLHCSSIWT